MLVEEELVFGNDFIFSCYLKPWPVIVDFVLYENVSFFHQVDKRPAMRTYFCSYGSVVFKLNQLIINRSRWSQTLINKVWNLQEFCPPRKTKAKFCLDSKQSLLLLKDGRAGKVPWDLDHTWQEGSPNFWRPPPLITCHSSLALVHVSCSLACLLPKSGTTCSLK